MDHPQGSSLDLSGLLAIIASTVAVALVVAAVAFDRALLLGAAAAVVVAAVTVVVVRRRGDAKSLSGPLDVSPIVDSSALEIGPAGEVGPLPDDAIAARAELLATLRHGFHPETDLPPPSAASEGTEAVEAFGDTGTSGDTGAVAPDADQGLAPALEPQTESKSFGSGEPHPTAHGDDQSPLVDPTTGLFTQAFFEASLPKRVSAARRGLRPLSVAAVTVVSGHPTDGAAVVDPHAVARAMAEVFRDADTIAVADDGLFLVLLEDTPEAGAVWTLERLRRDLTAEDPGRTMWAGVSCYPAYSFDADGLVTQARTALDAARQWQQDRIEIAPHASG